MKKLTLIADVLLISLSAGLFLPNSTINMAKYQSDNNKSLITEKDNITPEEVMDNQIPDELYDVGNEDQWYISQAVRRAVDKEEADNNAELFRKDDTSIVNCREIKDKEDNISGWTRVRLLVRSGTGVGTRKYWLGLGRRLL